MLSSYIEHPANCHFEGQDSDEDIILLLRAHPITNLSWFIPALLLFLLPVVLPKVITILGLNLPVLPPTFAAAFLTINYLLVIVIAFEGFLYWYFNVYILTDKRIIDVDFSSILFKNVDQAALEDVQEASSSVKGLFGLIFNMGDVLVQTAGAKAGGIDFQKVPHPDKVADVIIEQSEKNRS